ncbi:MAG: hypothetical protein KDD28_30885 [Phaeodactylibacter sp.]|nr:hypothetical protein [Phaeodactylibacter sp.]
MTILTTSITYKGVNIYHSDLRSLLSQVIYPDFLDGFETLSIMIVCMPNEEHQNEAYIYKGEPYISIALDYDAVAGLSYDEITVLCKKELVAYLNTLSGLPEKKVA